VSKVFTQFILLFTFLATPVFSVDYKCEGKEKGINTMTGKERIIPITYIIEIAKNSATINDMDNLTFTVNEDDDMYIMQASIGESQLLGEYVIRINKKTGSFKGQSWLFSRDNIVTKEGKCEIHEVTK
jgi:hypothetical protein